MFSVLAVLNYEDFHLCAFLFPLPFFQGVLSSTSVMLS